MRMVKFTEVEVIELPIIAGADHPTNCREVGGETWGNKRRAGGDTASVTVGWKAQKRTIMELDTFEKVKNLNSDSNGSSDDKKDRRRQRRRGVKRLSRALRKHLLGRQQKEDDITRTASASSSSEEGSPRYTLQKRRRKKQKKEGKMQKRSTPVAKLNHPPLSPFRDKKTILTSEPPVTPIQRIMIRDDTPHEVGDHTPNVPTHLVSPSPATTTTSTTPLQRTDSAPQPPTHIVSPAEYSTTNHPFDCHVERIDVTPKRKPRRGSMEFAKSVFRRGSIDNNMRKSDSRITMTPTQKFRPNERSEKDCTPKKLMRRGSMEYDSDAQDHKNSPEAHEEVFKARKDFTPKRSHRRTSMEHVKQFIFRRGNMEHSNPVSVQEKPETETMPINPPDLSNHSSLDMMVRPVTPVSSKKESPCSPKVSMRRSSLEHVTSYVRSTFRRGSISGKSSKGITAQHHQPGNRAENDGDDVSLDPLHFFDENKSTSSKDSGDSSAGTNNNDENVNVGVRVPTQRRRSMEHVTNLVRSAFQQQGQRRGRRSSMEHVKATISTIAKQPSIFAKIPIKLARNRLTEKKNRKEQQETYDDNSSGDHSKSYNSSHKSSFYNFARSAASGSMVESLKEAIKDNYISKDNHNSIDFNNSQSSALSDFMMEMLANEETVAATTHTVFIVPDDLHNSFGSVDFNPELENEEMQQDEPAEADAADDDASMPSLVHEESTTPMSLKEQIKINMDRFGCSIENLEVFYFNESATNDDATDEYAESIEEDSFHSMILPRAA